MSETRPDPDAILARLQHEERDASGRGRLRIYLGAFPGVGKTYAMLNEAQRRKSYGEDVVAGFVETHGRKNTVMMVEGLEVIPRRRIDYRGVTVEEMDLEAILKRHPAVCLVDELAHTNAPGSQHEKRYEEVEVLLDAGINVVSTLNVQHLESMNDTIEALTGVKVRETLPDAVLDEADEVILVDMSPEGARARMEHGHIYRPEQAQIALQRFFTLENLAALRELALRRTTQEVDHQLDELMRERQHNSTEAAVTVQVLVVVSDTEAARTMIRHAWRLAQGLHAELQVAYFKQERAEDASRQLARTLELAEDMNATIVPLEGDDVAKALSAYINAEGIDHLMLPLDALTRTKRFFGHSVAEEVLRAKRGLELHVVSV